MADGVPAGDGVASPSERNTRSTAPRSAAVTAASGEDCVDSTVHDTKKPQESSALPDDDALQSRGWGSRVWWLKQKLQAAGDKAVSGDASVRPPAAAPISEAGIVARPGWQAITQGIHILTYGLLAVVVATAARRNIELELLTTGVCIAFGLTYMACASRYHKLPPWQAQLWVLVLSLLWGALIPLEQTSLYLVFPLYFLYLRVMPDWRGIAAVIAATCFSIFSQSGHLTAGAILGPTVAALVSIGIDYAFRTLWKVSAEREALIGELIATRSQLAATERAQGVAAERQRIAHEIHDTLAQGLSSIQMLLYVADQELAPLQEQLPAGQALTQARARIAQAKQVAHDNLGEARAMIAALQPAALASSSIADALQRAAAGVVGVDVGIVIDGEPRPLPMRVEAALLRIAQGALGNVATHSQAEKAQVTLTYLDDTVRLDVVDNGVGFDPAKIAARPAGLGHVGLAAMRQRAREQQGSLTVEASPGQGCMLSVALPAPTA
ncbi:sensor histidine kinase [Corynebacterium choanae]|uniref:Sensor histidine kinase LiaS n=1 Tax=Corynebacterium choanae TaxID=1862358 RepID=A0A3G6J7U1_9CORY|nr:sensor histidine kinase [Corynebacterium choanae]AZA12510.1 Sensor histidine kinase LiaS [Corynebacterium choanae]